MDSVSSSRLVLFEYDIFFYFFSDKLCAVMWLYAYQLLIWYCSHQSGNTQTTRSFKKFERKRKIRRKIETNAKFVCLWWHFILTLADAGLYLVTSAGARDYCGGNYLTWMYDRLRVVDSWQFSMREMLNNSTTNMSLIPVMSLWGNNSRQVVHTHVPLLPSSTV